jgi:hypothetical protein
MYNQDSLCSRGSIEVMGASASRSDETCCGSFKDRREGSATNSMTEGNGCEKIQISCKAEDCTYNSAQQCTASAIDITGNNACTCKDTNCSTFCGCGCQDRA